MRSSYDSKLFEPCSHRTIKIIKTLLKLLQYGDVKSFLHKIFSERHRSELMRMLATATCHDSLQSELAPAVCATRDTYMAIFYNPRAQRPNFSDVLSLQPAGNLSASLDATFYGLATFLTFVHHIFHIFVLNNSASSYDNISN